MGKLAIIDGHNFLWRSYSVPFSFYSEKNIPLHVVSTYLKLIRRTVASIKPDLMVVIFDSDTTNDNFELLANYKANRKSFDEGEDCPYAHIPYVKKVLSFLDINYLELPNIEADDVVATITNAFCNKALTNKAYIFSSDTDFYQLLNKQVSVVKLKTGEEYEVIGPKYVKNKLGISPDRYVEFKSLVGDSADNIQGIKGVGPVTAKKILRGEIDYDVKEHEELLDLNKKLITLNCNCKKQWKFNNFGYNRDVLSISNKDIFQKCDF